MADLALEIGGVFTPDSILSAADRLAAQARVLAGEIFDAQPDVDEDFYLAWQAFFLKFQLWKSDNSGWFSRVWNTTRDELVDWVQTYNRLHADWITLHPETRAMGASVTSNDTIGGAVDRAGKAIGVALKDIAIGLAVLVGVGLVGYLAVKAARK